MLARSPRTQAARRAVAGVAVSGLLLAGSCGEAAPEPTARRVVVEDTEPRSEVETPAVPETLGVLATALVGEWQGEDCFVHSEDLGPTCETLELRDDGIYSWSAESDYVEFEHEGRWNVRAVDDNRGQLILEGASILAVAVYGDSLTVSGEEMARVTPMATQPPALATVSLPTANADIWTTEWHRSGGAVLDDEVPRTVEFDGPTYVAEFDNGCRVEGEVWGLRVEYDFNDPSVVTRARLFLEGVGACSAGPDGSSHGSLLTERIGDALYLRGYGYLSGPDTGAYRRLGLAPDGLRLEMILLGPLAQARVAVGLTVTNLGEEAIELTALEISAAPATSGGSGFSELGTPETVAESVSVTIAAGDSVTISVGLPMPESETVLIRASTAYNSSSPAWAPYVTLHATTAS